MTEDLEGRTLLSVGLDSSFGFGGVAQLNLPVSSATTTYSENINAVALQNGQVVEVGSLVTNMYSNGTFQGSTTTLLVGRLTTGGVLDTTFGSGGTQTIPVSSGGVTYNNVTADDIAVQSDGKIDVLGLASPSTTSTGSAVRLVVARLNANGSLDTTFGNGGFQLINFSTSTSTQATLSASALAVGPDGSIVAVGTTSTSTSNGQVFAIARLTPGGALDTSFNGAGTTTVNFKVGNASAELDTANAVVVQPDNKIVVVGSARLPTSGSSGTFSPQDIAVARLGTNGALDTSFNNTGMLTFNEDLGGSTSNDSANAVILFGTQIVLAGTSNQIFPASTGSGFTPSVSELNVTRLNANGSFDTTFNGSGKFLLALTQAGTTFNTRATSVVARPSGALLIGGTASEQNAGGYYGGGGPNGGLLLSLTPTGGLDTSFGTNGAAIIAGNDIDGRMVMQSDGKVDFLTFNGVARTTAPAPAAATTSIVTTGTGKNAKATGVTITFNTAVNPTLLTDPSLYAVRTVKGRKVIKLKKRGGVSYNAATQTLTLNFAGKTAVGSGFQVVVTSGGIVGADGQVLSTTPIVITPTTTSARVNAMAAHAGRAH
jgi:uncharacterized delta-60 repeat protein